jgi:hypothetical protein
MNRQWNNFSSFQFVFYSDQMSAAILKIPQCLFFCNNTIILMVNSNIAFSPMVKSIMCYSIGMSYSKYIARITFRLKNRSRVLMVFIIIYFGNSFLFLYSKTQNFSHRQSDTNSLEKEHNNTPDSICDGLSRENPSNEYESYKTNATDQMHETLQKDNRHILRRALPNI